MWYSVTLRSEKRSNALPPKFFAAIEPKRRIPRNNVVFVGALALTGAFLLPAVAGETTGFELGASLLNFGALIAFMGVNAAAFMRYYVREKQKKLGNLIPPVIGFAVCAVLWWNLSTKARIGRKLDRMLAGRVGDREQHEAVAGVE